MPPRPVTCSNRDELRAALEADATVRRESDPCAAFSKLLLVRCTHPICLRTASGEPPACLRAALRPPHAAWPHRAAARRSSTANSPSPASCVSPQAVMIGLVLVLRVNESLAAGIISSLSNAAGPTTGGLLSAPAGGALPWLRAAVVARPVAVLGGYAVAYLTLQALSMPGCALLNAVAGAALGVGLALPLVAALTALGSVLCFWGSQHYGAALLLSYLPDRLSVLRPLVARAREQGGDTGLALELVFLRVQPFAPSWVLNMAAPHVGVPAVVHFASALAGSIPRCLYTVALGGDLAAAAAAYSELGNFSRVPVVVGARLALAGGVLLAPLLLRQYCHIKPGSVAGYSDLYDTAPVVARDKKVL